jgi:hypothetical protein
MTRRPCSSSLILAAALLAGGCQTTARAPAPAGPPNYGGAEQPPAAAPGRAAFLPLSPEHVHFPHAQFSSRTGVSTVAEVYQPLADSINAHLAAIPGLRRLDGDAIAFGQSRPQTPWAGPLPSFGIRNEHCRRQPARSAETSWTFGGTQRQAAGDRRVFRVQAATPEWRSELRTAMERADVDHLLLFTLGPSYYFTTGAGVGQRQLQLGTDHAVDLPFHVRRGQCYGVVQLMAVLVDREGDVVRYGAEGLLAGRLLGGIAGSAADLLAEVSVEEVRDEAAVATRDDLAGTPRVWRVATNQLLRRVAGLQAPQ